MENVINIDESNLAEHNDSSLSTKKEKKKYNRWNIDSARDVITRAGYILVSKKYKNVDTKLEMICPKGHTCYIALYNFINNGRCGNQLCKAEKMAETNMKKYGVPNPFGNKTIQEKIKNTNFKKYGSENPAQNPIIKEKIK